MGTTLRPNSPVSFEITHLASRRCSYRETPTSTCISHIPWGPQGLSVETPPDPPPWQCTLSLLGPVPQGCASVLHSLCSWGTQAPHIPIPRPQGGLSDPRMASPQAPGARTILGTCHASGFGKLVLVSQSGSWGQRACASLTCEQPGLAGALAPFPVQPLPTETLGSGCQGRSGLLSQGGPVRHCLGLQSCSGTGRCGPAP